MKKTKLIILAIIFLLSSSTGTILLWQDNQQRSSVISEEHYNIKENKTEEAIIQEKSEVLEENKNKQKEGDNQEKESETTEINNQGIENPEKEIKEGESQEKIEITEINKEEIKEVPSIVLYSAQGCPHCAIVEEYIKEHQLNEKILIEKKEVYYNKNDLIDLEEKAKKCGIDQSSIGIPLVWDGNRCFMGGDKVINYLSNYIN